MAVGCTVLAVVFAKRPKNGQKWPKTIQKYLSIHGSYAMIEKLKNHVC